MRGDSQEPADSLRIVVRGAPIERGRQYGQQAREQIHRSIENYRGLLAHRVGISWPEAVARARKYERSIADFAPYCLEEIRGVAEGASVDPGDILALNSRSELMFAAAGGGAAAMAGECTSFGLLPEVTEPAHIVIGQNWDWVPFARETVVVLEAHRDDGPNFVTLLEAGHLAKVGFNASGLGVCTNTLVSSVDDGRSGVPYHILLRALLDAETMSDAMRTLYGAERAFSANYLIGHADGLAVNVETLPGGPEGVRVMMPKDGTLAHSNHFLTPELVPLDARIATHPNTIFRLDAMRRALRRAESTITIEDLMQALRGHLNHPDGVCSHPDERIHPFDQRATITSVIADLTTGRLWIAMGPPCSRQYVKHAYRLALEAPLGVVSNA